MRVQPYLIYQRIVAVGECLSDFRQFVVVWIQLDHAEAWGVREKVRLVECAKGERFNHCGFRGLFMLLDHHLVRHNADKVIDDANFVAVVEKRLVELIDLLLRYVVKDLRSLADRLYYRLYSHLLRILRLLLQRKFIICR